jgi:hypothetical protein
MFTCILLARPHSVKLRGVRVVGILDVFFAYWSLLLLPFGTTALHEYRKDQQE